MASTCKHCAYFQHGTWCDSWERSVHPNTIKCARFLSTTGEQQEDRPFRPMISVTITPEEQSAMHKAKPMGRPRVVTDEAIETAARLNAEGKTAPEIAEEMGVKTHRVYYMLKVARNRSQQRLEETKGAQDVQAEVLTKDAERDQVESPAETSVEEATAPVAARTTEQATEDIEREPPAPPTPPGPDVSELTRSLNALGRIVERLDGRVEKLEDKAEADRERVDAVAHAAARELQVIRESVETVRKSVEALRRDVDQLRHEFMRHGHIWPSGDVALPIMGRETA